MNFPEKLTKTAPYEPAKGLCPIRLDANESCFSVPQQVAERIRRALEGLSFERYPDPDARRVREAAAKAFGVQAQQLVAGNGSDELIFLILTAFLPRGGRLMVLEPDFSMYRFYAGLCELEILSHERAPEFRVSVEEILSHAEKSRPDVLIFSNPCNPAGRGFCRQEIRHLLAGLPGTLVVVDEAYMDFWDQSMLAEVEEFPNLLILRTLSKAYALAGIRLGFAAANQKLAALLNRCRSPFNINCMTQAAGAAALVDSSWVAGQVEEILQNKRLLQQNLYGLCADRPEYQVMGSRTNFINLLTPRCREIHQRLAERGISVRLFGALGLLRMTVGTKEENAALLGALTEILQEE